MDGSARIGAHRKTIWAHVGNRAARGVTLWLFAALG